MKFVQGVLYFPSDNLETVQFLANIKASKDIPLRGEKFGTLLILEDMPDFDLAGLSNEQIPNAVSAKRHRFFKRQFIFNLLEYQGEIK